MRQIRLPNTRTGCRNCPPAGPPDGKQFAAPPAASPGTTVDRSDDGDRRLRLERTGQRRIERDLDGARNEDPADMLCGNLRRCSGLRQVDVLREHIDVPDAIEVKVLLEQFAVR